MGAGTGQMQKPSWLTSRDLAFFAMSLAAGFLLYLLRATDFFTSVPGDVGDARFNSVVLEHVYNWVRGSVPSLWNPTYFFPFPFILAFSDGHFGSAPLYTAFRWLGADREGAYVLWFVAGFALTHAAAYINARRFGLSVLGAAVAAFVFAFTLPMLAQEGHPQLIYRFAAPFALFAMWESLDRRTLFPLWRVAVWTAIEFYCAIYLGVFLGFLLAALVVAYALAGTARGSVAAPKKTAPSRPIGQWVLFSTAIAASGIAVLWLLATYMATSRLYGLGRSIDEIATMLPRPLSYLLMDRMHGLWRIMPPVDVPMRGEHQLFIGFSVAALSVIGLWGAMRGKVQPSLATVMATSFALLFALTLYVGGYSLYLMLTVLPGLNAIRSVTRIIVLMALPLSLLAGLGADYLRHAARSSPRWPRVALAVLLLGVVGETFLYEPVRAPIAEWRRLSGDLRARLPDAVPPDAILFATANPDREPFYVTEITAMIVAQDLGIPTVNGYSGHRPPGYLRPEPCVTAAERLRDYPHFSGITEAELAPILARVITVNRDPCPP